MKIAHIRCPSFPILSFFVDFEFLLCYKISSGKREKDINGYEQAEIKDIEENCQSIKSFCDSTLSKKRILILQNIVRGNHCQGGA